MTYIQGGDDVKGCLFCHAYTEGDATEANLVLARTGMALVMLNKYPYINAHILLAPRRHVARLQDLTPEEGDALFRLSQATTEILGEVLRPDGYNIGMNLGAAAGAGIADHLHYHVIPRWSGDTNFMTTLAEVRVMPEHLTETYGRLRPFFRELEKGS